MIGPKKVQQKMEIVFSLIKKSEIPIKIIWDKKKINPEIFTQKISLKPNRTKNKKNSQKN